MTELAKEKLTAPKDMLKPAKSRVSILLALLSLSVSGALGFYAIYGKDGLFVMRQHNQVQQQQINNLIVLNHKLQLQVNNLAQQQAQTEQSVKQLSPSQVNFILNQFNALLNSANQSLVLYHDYPATLKLLNYAQTTLASSSDARFNELKIKLSQDISRIQNLNGFDATTVASQVDSLSIAVNQLTTNIPLNLAVKPAEHTSAFSKFLTNIANSLLSLVQINKTVNPQNNPTLVNDEAVNKQQLAFALLNAKQALYSHNQSLWQQSLTEANTIVSQAFIQNKITENFKQKINELGQLQLSQPEANLDATMQAWVKLQQMQ
jgi:uncharacterized protein HemX